MCCYALAFLSWNHVERKFLLVNSSFALVVVIVLVWTLVDPFVWERIDIQTNPLETFGRCNSNHFGAFFGTCVGILITLSSASFYFAWRGITRQETGSIMYASFTTLQCWSFGLPMMIVLGTTSAEGAYFGRILLVWVFSFTSVAVVAGPTTARAILVSSDRERLDDRPRMIMFSMGDNYSMADDGSHSSANDSSIHIRS